ncbi:efflux RND transporter periplasmic adaptor subunit [Aquabacterium humicola]|uniref:efflux RND transporter periplasmic adaptor subunit n=1 Tax=Aquabacterium humicola TaxID=3237377 RepID=UPI0025436036|nr:efflux RND transporter periplasmic adaptor subunit [Rubrivivax pictus]
MNAASLARRGVQAAAVLATMAALAAAAVLPLADDAAPAARRAPAAAAGLAAADVVVQRNAAGTAYEGVVEALRQTTLAAQVPGAVVELPVRAGDRVRAGQVLVRLDARTAEQAAAAGAAQVRAARASLDMATREFERQQQMFVHGATSQAALDRADAAFKTAQAESAAQLAHAAAAKTQSELHVIRAPYAGVVAGVAVVLGDMAMPGRPLLTLYDPTALRVSAAIPLTAGTAAAARGGSFAAQAEVPGAVTGLVRPLRVQLLPTADAASHTMTLRLDLPPHGAIAPGMFARAWLPGADTDGGTSANDRLFVPAQALLRRSELDAVYVIGRNGQALLRQVRPGRSDGNQVEILAGVAAGERVALDPQAAARMR